MRRMLPLAQYRWPFVLGLLLVFFSITEPVLAYGEAEGCCYVPQGAAPPICVPSTALHDPNDLDPILKDLCDKQSGSYATPCHCSQTLAPQTGSNLTNVVACCVYGPNNCSPLAGPSCVDSVSNGTLLTARYVASACTAIRECDTANATLPEEKPTTPIRFKPQLPIPGSAIFNGQEIILTGSTLGEYIAALYVFVVSAISILAAVLVFYGGIIWLTAGGDRGRVQTAKEQISSAIAGIIIAFGAYLLLLTISPKLVRFNSLEIKPVPTRLAAFEEVPAPGGRLPSGTISLNGLDQTWYSNVRAKYGSYITSALQAYPTLEEKLVYALIFIESSGNPNAQSGLACGLMQVKPSTAGYADCDRLLDPQTNINAGVAYLARLFQIVCPSEPSCNTAATKCPGTNHRLDYTYVLAAYNGGPGANCYSNACADGQTKWECTKNEQPPPGGYSPTRDYVVNVPAALERIRTFLP